MRGYVVSRESLGLLVPAGYSCWLIMSRTGMTGTSLLVLLGLKGPPVTHSRRGLLRFSGHLILFRGLLSEQEEMLEGYRVSHLVR